MSYKIHYIKKIKSKIGIDNEPYDVYLCIKNGNFCIMNDMGYCDD